MSVPNLELHGRMVEDGKLVPIWVTDTSRKTCLTLEITGGTWGRTDDCVLKIFIISWIFEVTKHGNSCWNVSNGFLVKEAPTKPACGILLTYRKCQSTQPGTAWVDGGGWKTCPDLGNDTSGEKRVPTLKLNVPCTKLGSACKCTKAALKCTRMCKCKCLQ